MSEFSDDPLLREVWLNPQRFPGPTQPPPPYNNHMHRRTLLNLTLGTALILLTAKAALACFWDRDTLAQEAAGLPGVVEVLLGRIDRWPPEYYAMRLERVTKQLVTEPNNLELYDDAAVASDRLKRFDEAIEWMARKRAILDRFPENDPTRIEHEYRHLANLGTHHAHRWIANGGSGVDLADLNSAIELIRAAIHLKPYAHFGREKVQLGFLEALGYTRMEGRDNVLLPVSIMLSGRFLPDQLTAVYSDRQGEFSIEDGVSSLVTECVFQYGKAGLSRSILGSDLRIDASDLTEGLIGLMVLGDAWTSIDVHETLALSLIADESRLVMAQLAALRGAELASNGARSILFPNRDADVPLWFGESIAGFVSTSRQVDEYFDRARPLVEKINAERAAFIAARLAEGKHPDTHTDFWDGYREASLPRLPGTGAARNFRIGLVALCLVLVLPIWWLAKSDWRRGGRASTIIGVSFVCAFLYGIVWLGFTFTQHIITPGNPKPSERWNSYDTFRATMQSNQP